MSIKEQVADLIVAEGYDYVTALGMAQLCIAEFKASNRAQGTYHIGKTSFTISKQVVS